ncbi:MAG: hypothetical protein GX889_12575 [Clostridiales bacterium]|nr:hypothetical protein [Clostridiales bacterium]
MLKKHLNNQYLKEIQVPNIEEAKYLKEERALLVNKIYTSFWKKICEVFGYEYKDKHDEIIINRNDVNNIHFLVDSFYLEDDLLKEFKRFKIKNDRMRTLKIEKNNEENKLRFINYIKNNLDK